MYLFLGFLLALVLGTISLWIVGRFSPDPPNIVEVFIGVCIIEISSIVLSQMEVVGIILILALTVFVVIKVVRMSGIYAFYAIFLYSSVRSFLTLLVFTMIN